ncbi:hypothetical protein LFAB_16735 [Lactiplantibacillus fabifermentans T30PCM01]|uniref:Uncharacterized protein n=1 Tax=Lactiplantibacillus fabifermentans T30PCM01 TaxID=1400520 RepID=W6T3V4_9LACO|nr:hypothetical protein LFAB_16735 [Lactiplantibacillus fabifermentans T30PCM01]
MIIIISTLIVMVGIFLTAVTLKGMDAWQKNQNK